VYIDDASVAFEAVMLKDMLVECRDEDDIFVVDPPLNLLRRVGLKKAVVWKRRDTGMVTIAFKILCLIGVSMISFVMCVRGHDGALSYALSSAAALLSFCPPRREILFNFQDILLSGWDYLMSQDFHKFLRMETNFEPNAEQLLTAEGSYFNQLPSQYSTNLVQIQR